MPFSGGHVHMCVCFFPTRGDASVIRHFYVVAGRWHDMRCIQATTSSPLCITIFHPLYTGCCCCVCIPPSMCVLRALAFRAPSHPEQVLHCSMRSRIAAVCVQHHPLCVCFPLTVSSAVCQSTERGGLCASKFIFCTSHCCHTCVRVAVHYGECVTAGCCDKTVLCLGRSL